MFTALAENFGFLDDKVNLFAALGPLTYLTSVDITGFDALASNLGLLKLTLDGLGLFEIYGKAWESNLGGLCTLAPEICGNPEPPVRVTAEVDAYTANLAN